MKIIYETLSAGYRYDFPDGIGKIDLRIAAIALEQKAPVVSRNLRDFRRVPNLAVEDWPK
jgi:predicted nucleic acid-binding protein